MLLEARGIILSSKELELNVWSQKEKTFFKQRFLGQSVSALPEEGIGILSFKGLGDFCSASHI